MGVTRGVGVHRELLAGATRDRRVRDDDDEVVAPQKVRTPGKLTSDEAETASPSEPGKRSKIELETAEMTPAQALRYSDWMLAERGVRVDRRAEHDDDDLDSGALANAFGFLADSRDGQPLPEELARQLGAEFGIDLGNVRVHTDDRAAQAAATLHARAFTIGNDIYFAAGAYDPSSDQGMELIAHEVAHVGQQRGGTPSSDRKVSSPGDAHEREADHLAERFTKRRSARFTAKPGDDPAMLVEHARREGRRLALPFIDELEEHFGTSFGFVEAYTGPAAALACQALSASAFVVQNLVMLADPSPQRELLLHELTHVVQQGQRRAPSRFAFGSLEVSDPGDAVEVEARSGTSHREVASPNTIHRAGPDPKPATAGTDASETQKRIQYFVGLKQKECIAYPVDQDVKGKTEKVYAYRNATKGYRYTKASPHPWSLSAYSAILDTSPADQNLKKSATTYGRDLQEMLKTENATKYRVTRVSDRTYAFIMDGDWVGAVEDIRPDARKDADPEEQFKAYFAAVNVLVPKGRLDAFTYEKYDQKTCTFDEKEADLYRRAMTDAIARGYAKLGNPGWHDFYKEVMVERLFPAKYNGVQGSIFEKLVKLTCGLELEANRPLFINPKGKKVLTKEPRIGDAAFFGKKGNVIIDDKAAAAGIDLQQCREYELITNPAAPIPGYFKGDDPEKAAHIYKAVAYAVPDKTIANKVKNQIEGLFPDNKAAIWQRFHISPDPDGLKSFLMTFNPTIRLQTADTGQSSYTFSNPPTLIPGVMIKTARIEDDKAAGQLKSGTLDMGIDMGGALSVDSVQKTVVPSTGPVAGGTVDNKFGSFKSKLDQLLGPVTIDGKLIDGGVEATIELKAGAAKIPQFTLDGAKLTARYVQGALTVTGDVGLTHKSNKISGKVKVSWSGGQWSFDGQATLAAGLIDGLGQTTLGVKYEGGKTKIYCLQASYEHKFGAITVSGALYNLEYGVDDGMFSGSASLEADLGMFGKAKAEGTLEQNKIKSASFVYDSPELKYPAKSATPSLKGNVGGTVTYENDKFSGAIRGTANLNIPALKKLAGESGVGLAVNATINADGSYSGTVATTTPLTFGKHLQVPSLSCTIKPDGSLEGSFEIKVVKIKFLNEASIKCKVTKAGVEIEEAKIEVPFGTENQSKFWGKLAVGYSKTKGLEIGGQVNAKIKEGMIATGDLKYSTETSTVSLKMTVSEITLLDKTVSKTLFKAAKQIPIINVWGLGVYIDIGFDLGFDFGFKLGFKPTVDFEGLSLETFEYTKIAAKLELLGDIFARLTGTPKLGLGIFALDPAILRGGGGLKVPIVGEAKIKPTGTLNVSYAPDGGVTGDAKVGMGMTFGITGSVKPYAEFSVLNDLWNPKWEGEALTQFEILKPKELFNFTVDLGGDMTKKEAPALPEQNSAKAATKPVGDKILPEQKSAPTDHAGPAASKTKDGPTSPVAESGDEGPFSLAALAPLLEKLPGAASVKKMLQKAGEVWDKIKGFFGRIMKAFKSFFDKMANQLEEILDGFAKEGLGYVPKLVKKIVGDSVYEIIEPLIKYLSKSADGLLDLFETNPPTGLTDFMPWVWKVAAKAFHLASNSLVDFVSALREMLGNMADVTKKLINRAVADGWIGVKRHSFYIWRPWPLGDYHFVAAAQFKVLIPGVVSIGPEGPTSFLLSPDGAVALGLYTFLEQIGTPVTFQGWDEAAKEPYNDRWTGAGAR